MLQVGQWAASSSIATAVGSSSSAASAALSFMDSGDDPHSPVARCHTPSSHSYIPVRCLRLET
jgi:hypothetical protein